MCQYRRQFVIASCISLALETKQLDSSHGLGRVLWLLDTLYLAVFATDMSLKVFCMGLVGMRVKENTISHDRFQEFVATLGIPLVTVLRDTQNYVHLAAHGLTLFDVAPGKVERDLAQFEPLGRWLTQPAKGVPLE